MATRYATFQATSRATTLELGIGAGNSAAVVSPGPTATGFLTLSYSDTAANALADITSAMSALGYTFVVDSASAPATTTQTRNHGAQASAPTSPTPAVGDTYYNTTSSFWSVYNGSSWSTGTIDQTVNFIINGGGAEIADGVAGDLQVDYAATILSWTLLADQSGSIVVDVWKTTYASAPPTVANTITGSDKPTITTATKATSSALTGWTTSIASGNVLRFNVDSCNTIQRCTVALKVRRSLF